MDRTQTGTLVFDRIFRVLTRTTAEAREIAARIKAQGHPCAVIDVINVTESTVEQMYRDWYANHADDGAN